MKLKSLDWLLQESQLALGIPNKFLNYKISSSGELKHYRKRVENKMNREVNDLCKKCIEYRRNDCAGQYENVDCYVSRNIELCKENPILTVFENPSKIYIPYGTVCEIQLRNSILETLNINLIEGIVTFCDNSRIEVRTKKDVPIGDNDTVYIAYFVKMRPKK